MKKTISKYLESCRVSTPRLYSNASYGRNGAFEVVDGSGTAMLVICSDQLGWEHVSVTVLEQKRTPTWKEMDFIKSLFWEDTETVVQLHVPREMWINQHEYCLHLWKPVGVEIPLPPKMFVGIQKAGAGR